jgi:pimeloyl-ACP methyl ester carboxylesterase
MDNDAAGLAESLRGMGAGAMQPVWQDLRSISVQCSFVAGQLDHAYVASARRLAESVPNGRVVIVQRAGHAAHQERPEAFARLLLAHLEAASERSEASPSSSTSA